MLSLPFIRAGVLDKGVIAVYTKAFYGDSFTEYCQMQNRQPEQEAKIFVITFREQITAFIYYPGAGGINFNPLAPYSLLIPHFLQAMNYTDKNFDELTKRQFVRTFARIDDFIPLPKRDWPGNPLQEFVDCFKQALKHTTLPAPYDQLYQQRLAPASYPPIPEDWPETIEQYTYSGKVFQSASPVVETLPLIINHFYRLGFAATGFDASNIQTFKTAEVFSSEFIEDQCLPDNGYVYHLPIAKKIVNNPDFQLAYNLFFFAEIHNKVFFRILFIQGKPFEAEKFISSALGLSLRLWLYRLTLSGLTIRQYTTDSELTESELEDKQMLYFKSLPFIKASTEPYERQAAQPPFDFEPYKNHGMVLPETPVPEYLLDNRPAPAVPAFEYNEVYQTTAYSGGQSDFRLVCTSPMAADGIKPLQDWLLAQQWIHATDKTPVQQEVPGFIIDKDYLGRMKPLDNVKPGIDPFATVGLYCDEEESEEPTPAEQQRAIGEQPVVYQHWQSTPRFSHSEQLIADIHIAQPVQGTAYYAYCDKDFYDDPRLWGEEADLEGINPAIRRGSYGLILYFSFAEGRQIKLDSTLARHIRELIQYARDELNITLQYDLLGEYAVSLEEWEVQANDLEDFTRFP